MGISGGGSSSRPEEPVRRTRFEPLDNISEISLANVPASDEKGSFNYDDTMTTNLYLGNINPKVRKLFFGRSLLKIFLVYCQCAVFAVVRTIFDGIVRSIRSSCQRENNVA